MLLVAKGKHPKFLERASIPESNLDSIPHFFHVPHVEKEIEQ
jgi:hypothetical protein